MVAKRICIWKFM